MHSVADRFVTLAEVYYLDSAQSQELESPMDGATHCMFLYIIHTHPVSEVFILSIQQGFLTPMPKTS